MAVKSLLELLDSAGKHVLACSCGSMTWAVLVDQKKPKGLELLCTFCHSHSGLLKPESGLDSQVIKEAIDEINEKRKVEKESREGDCGEKTETKPKGPLLN